MSHVAESHFHRHILKKAESRLAEARKGGSNVRPLKLPLFQLGGLKRCQVLSTDISQENVGDSDTILSRLAEENKQKVTIHGVKSPQGEGMSLSLTGIGLRSSAADLITAVKTQYPGVWLSRH